MFSFFYIFMLKFLHIARLSSLYLLFSLFIFLFINLYCDRCNLKILFVLWPSYSIFNICTYFLCGIVDLRFYFVICAEDVLMLSEIFFYQSRRSNHCKSLIFFLFSDVFLLFCFLFFFVYFMLRE